MVQEISVGEGPGPEQFHCLLTSVVACAEMVAPPGWSVDHEVGGLIPRVDHAGGFLPVDGSRRNEVTAYG